MVVAGEEVAVGSTTLLLGLGIELPKGEESKEDLQSRRRASRSPVVVPRLGFFTKAPKIRDFSDAPPAMRAKSTEQQEGSELFHKMPSADSGLDLHVKK